MFNTTSSMTPNTNKLLYENDNLVLEWNRNVSQLQFKTTMLSRANSAYPRYLDKFLMKNKQKQVMNHKL